MNGKVVEKQVLTILSIPRGPKLVRIASATATMNRNCYWQLYFLVYI